MAASGLSPVPCQLPDDRESSAEFYDCRSVSTVDLPASGFSPTVHAKGSLDMRIKMLEAENKKLNRENSQLKARINGYNVLGWYL